MNIDDIKTPQHMEFKVYATFCSRLMTGIDLEGRWVQMEVNNRPKSSDDAAKYKVDARITVDGDAVGVLDVERKPAWHGGPWPYPKINFPYRPFSRFETGFGSPGSYSSKALELCEAWREGRPAFWVPYSSPIADSSGQQMLITRQSCLVVPAEHLFGELFERRLERQPTRYGRSVEVLSVPNDAGILCTSEEQFSSVILSHVSAWLSSQEEQK